MAGVCWKRASLKSSVCVAEQGRHIQGVVIWRKRLRSLLLEQFSAQHPVLELCVYPVQVPAVTEEDPGMQPGPQLWA